MRTKTTLWVAALAAVVAAPVGAWAQPGLASLPPQANALAAPGNSVSGDAFGVEVITPGAPGLAKQPAATLAQGGPRLVEAEQGPLVTPPGSGNLSTDAARVSTTGVVGKNAATAQGRSTLTNVDILGGVVKAEQVMAVASSASNGRRASSNAAGSQVLGLIVNGVSLGDVTPAPNTTISVPGVGDVILNEQLATGDGISTTGLQVNMIHVVQKDPLTGAAVGDIIVGSATSAARFTR
jgi:hypothetical protein